MAYTSGVADSVRKTELDDVFNSKFDVQLEPGYAMITDPRIFIQKPFDKGVINTEQFQGTGYIQQKTELQDAIEKTPRVGNAKTTTVLTFADSVPISKELFDDDQHDTIDMIVANFGHTARVSREREGFGLMRNGFTTEQTNDSVAWFSNSHVTLNGTSVDNLETGVASDDNFEILVNSLRTQVTQDGTRAGHRPRVTVTPTALHKDLVVITKSEKRSGTGNNDVNYYSWLYPEMMVSWNLFLDAAEGGSDTAYFLLSDNHSARRIIREDKTTHLEPWTSARNHAYRYDCRYREVYQVISYEGAVASNGSV